MKVIELRKKFEAGSLYCDLKTCGNWVTKENAHQLGVRVDSKALLLGDESPYASKRVSKVRHWAFCSKEHRDEFFNSGSLYDFLPITDRPEEVGADELFCGHGEDADRVTYDRDLVCSLLLHDPSCEYINGWPRFQIAAHILFDCPHGLNEWWKTGEIPAYELDQSKVVFLKERRVLALLSKLELQKKLKKVG